MQGFVASSLKAIPHLLNIGRDLPKMRLHMHRREKVNQKFRSLPKQEVMRQISHYHRFHPIVRSHQTWHRVTTQCTLTHVRGRCFLRLLLYLVHCITYQNPIIIVTPRSLVPGGTDSYACEYGEVKYVHKLSKSNNNHDP